MRHLAHGRSPRSSVDVHPGPVLEELLGEVIDPLADEAESLRPGAAAFPFQHVSLTSADPGLEGPAAEALELIDRGRFREAVVVLRRAIEEEDPGGALRLLLARILEEHGETGEAHALLDELLSRDPLHLRALVARGTLRSKLGLVEEAERDLREAVRAAPEDAQAVHALGTAYLRRGLGKESVAQFRHAVKLDPDRGIHWQHLGEGLARAGDEEAALEALQRAVALLPHEARIWQQLGRLLDRLGRSEDAMAMYRKAREVSAP